MEKSTGGRLWVKIFWLWLTLAVVVTMMCGLTYLLVQQDIRQSANYPQSHMAEDVTSASSSGPLSGSRGESSLVDISTSLAPFLTTFDADGNVIQSNAVLDGSTPVPPHGVFGYAEAQANGEDRFTWQPQAGVRIAAVLVYHAGNGDATGGTVGGFFALSGRSLHDVEILESRLMDDTFFAWIVASVVMFVLSIFTVKVFSVSGREKSNREEKPVEKPIEKSPPQQSIVVPPSASVTIPITVPSQFSLKDNSPTNTNTNTNTNKIL
jgi:phosphate/sulfate permease